MTKKLASAINATLIKYYQSTIEINRIDVHLQQLLPEPLKNNCHASAFIKGVLILTTAHANFAYQLKFLLPTLRDQLRKEAKLYGIASIKVHIKHFEVKAPEAPKTIEKTEKKPPKSLEEALASLENTLENKGINI